MAITPAQRKQFDRGLVDIERVPVNATEDETQPFIENRARNLHKYTMPFGALSHPRLGGSLSKTDAKVPGSLFDHFWDCAGSPVRLSR